MDIVLIKQNGDSLIYCEGIPQTLSSVMVVTLTLTLTLTKPLNPDPDQTTNH